MSLVGQTIDVENCSQLIALVRYRHGGTIMEDLLFFNSEDNQQSKRHLQKGEELFLQNMTYTSKLLVLCVWKCSCYGGK